MSTKNTLLEQAVNMYSISDNSIEYWKDWATRFVECCQNYMGWEVVQGPGTSLGNIVGSIYTLNNYRVPVKQSAGYDCDWTKTNGIAEEWQNSVYNVADNNYPLYTGWFYDMAQWPIGANKYGIDETTGRFDIIVYTAESENGEKIGFRIKYPICSVGYSTPSNVECSTNNMYTVPFFCLYSSTKGILEFYNNNNNNESSDVKFSRYDYSKYIMPFCGKIYYYTWAVYSPFVISKRGITEEGLENINESTTQLNSIKWSLNFQKSPEFNRIRTSINATFYEGTNSRYFYNYWKEYNKFYYHFSSNKDTSYLYITNQENQVAFKIITTALDNGEKIIFMDGPWELGCKDSSILFNVGMSTNSIYTQSGNLHLIKRPIRPYKQVNSNIGKFTFSKALLPNQNVLCKDLYYVTKRDSNEAIGNGAYVLVKDKELTNRYFRVIPFGSYYSYDRPGSDANLSYFAFPISDPEKNENDNVEVIT